MRKMKDSGIEWIGEIPENWEIHRLARLGDFSGSGNDKKINPDEPEVKMINYVDVYNNKTYELSKDNEYMHVTCPEEKRAELLVKKGDLIFTPSSETIEDIGVSALVVDDLENTVYSYHVLRYKTTEKLDFLYKKYLCNNHYARNYFSSKAVGTVRKTLNRDDFKNLKIALPPIDEQRKIAKYLDEICAEIDRIITAKEKTNELLKERRQSIIYEAVTKGLNPDAPMKDSGIEWVGMIPENWTIWRMKHLASKPLQYGANATGIEFREDIPRYVRITDISADGKLIDEGKQSLEMEIAQDYMLEDGDILFARSGATAGKSFYYESQYGPCCFAGYLIKLRTDKTKAFSKFLYYYTLTQAYEKWTQQIFIQSTIQNISADKYNNLWFAIPETLEEQKKIVDYLDQRCGEMDLLISANEETIQKLKEYRQSIIYEAVTGKIEI